MSELYLIAHKVRGEPAFDAATKMECPHCHDANSCGDYEGPTCPECEGTGHWWIIPTSGHRAYPFWHLKMTECCLNETGESILYHCPDMPPSLPDHYPTRAEPSRESALLAMLPKPISRPIPRKF